MRSRLVLLALILALPLRALGEMFDGPLGIGHSRDVSGTAWQPDATPVNAVHFMSDDWMFMVHGLMFAGWDDQSSTRRGNDLFMATNWGMLMAERELLGGELTLRSMLSLEPATVGRGGYPLLLQSGEALHGQPLHDRQHPHDLFMELAALYRREVSEDVGAELYLALAGEPALGPPGFSHRRSALGNPFAPIGHHWQDSTHISFGVVTGGVFTRVGKLEASWFNGREPDANRWDLDLRRLDSYSVRLSANPTDTLSLQVSGGRLHSPESLEPGVGVTRVTGSLTWDVGAFEEGNWATTAVFGENWPQGEPMTYAALVESNLELDRHHTLFGRAEFARKTGHDLDLGEPRDETRYSTAQTTLGYVYDFAPVWSVVPGLGAAFTVDYLDHDLERFYGQRVGYGFMVFARLTAPRLARD
jgi:hypothetical protein